MSSSSICAAIASRKVISFRYKGANRTVEPHLVGNNSEGELTLSGWQLSGGSGVGWRDFHLDLLSALSVTDQTFPGPRPGYNPADTTISQIVCRL